MMRITTGMVFEQGVSSMQRQNAELFKVQQQIATGRRVVTPSDDPVAAARALEVSQAKSVADQYTINQNNAESALTELEGQLASVGDTIQYVRQLALQGANGAINDSDRASIATELRGRFDQLLALANSRDGAGNYMFSGYQTDTKPYDAVVGGAVTYNGDQGIRQIQTAPSRQTTVSAPGPDVFTGLFETLSNLVTALETPSVPGAGNSAAVSAVTTAVEGFDTSLDKVLTVRARVGTQRSELTSLQDMTSSLSVQYATQLSELQDLDLADAITRLSQHQLSLEAAQKSFAQINQLSLFNYV